MFLIITKKKWNLKNFQKINKKLTILSDLNLKKVIKINPKIIFFIYWSKIIPKAIFNNYLCIQFHSSDLPKYRGGSPIQHQILSGLKKTKITAFKVNDKIDSGKVCLKKSISLKGKASEIYDRVENKCIQMISEIISKKKIIFKKQKETDLIHKRRETYESNIELFTPNKKITLYDFIRAHDADVYPKTFIKTKNFRFELFDAYSKKGSIYGKFKCIKK